MHPHQRGRCSFQNGELFDEERGGRLQGGGKEGSFEEPMKGRRRDRKLVTSYVKLRVKFRATVSAPTQSHLRVHSQRKKDHREDTRAQREQKTQRAAR